ncbi:ORF6N domain-containing protein [Fibrobacter sp. UWB12]|uniref:ORF6N domain-containing protein n=1 Tax=Fibrobacter sp. UWB12 TaxID=1896203 RepID=UPI0009216C2C|nr:ORF6N domain-containing protein [Fibrobacter sp. UWB12]SHK90454.1 ORF6N domain-containing protein [Fibrobacter sp. UWB12]
MKKNIVQSETVWRSQFATSKLANSQIASKIVVIRDVQVMIDRDIAELYGVETKRLKEQVNRNSERFPEMFMFQLDNEEFAHWRSQFATSKSDQKGLRYAPYAFTEQGVAMLSAVLRSEKAIKVSIEIMNAFVQMRHYLHRNIAIASRLDAVENKVDAKFLEHETKFRKIDENFSKIFHVLDSSPQKAKEGVFFKGQIFDAYAFFQNIIKTVKKEIVLIDGYVDLSVLERLSVKQKNVSVKIYTHPKAELRQADVEQFNKQYPTASMDYTQKMHDRFLIIDNKDLYLIGASLKDLGKQCFAFSKMDDPKMLIPMILANLR